MKTKMEYLNNGDIKLSAEFEDNNEKHELMNEDRRDLEDHMFEECLDEFMRILPEDLGDLTDKFMITDVFGLEDKPMDEKNELAKTNVWFLNNVKYFWYEMIIEFGYVIFTQRGRML